MHAFLESPGSFTNTHRQSSALPRRAAAPAGVANNLSAVARFRAVAERHGWSGALASAAYRASRRKLPIRYGYVLAFNTSVSDTLLGDSPWSGPSDLTFRFLAGEEVQRFAAQPENDLSADFAERLADGRNLCFAALDGGILANYTWFAVEALEAEHNLGVGLTLADNVACAYKAYTHPGYRGRGIHQAAFRRAALALARRRIEHLVLTVEYGNWTSLVSHSRLGCRVLGRIARLETKRAAVSWYAPAAGRLGAIAARTSRRPTIGGGQPAQAASWQAVRIASANGSN